MPLTLYIYIINTFIVTHLYTNFNAPTHRPSGSVVSQFPIPAPSSSRSNNGGAALPDTQILQNTLYCIKINIYRSPVPTANTRRDWRVYPWDRLLIVPLRWCQRTCVGGQPVSYLPPNIIIIYNLLFDTRLYDPQVGVHVVWYVLGDWCRRRSVLFNILAKIII